MKNNIKQLSKRLSNRRMSGILVFMVAFGVIGLITLLRSLAAGNTLYLTPVASNVEAGQDVTVTLRIDAETGINAIDSTITYDQSKLQFKSIDDSASDLPLGLIAENGSGTVQIVRGVASSTLTGDLEIAKVTFTVLASATGSTQLTTSGEASNAGAAVGLEYEHATVTVPATELDQNPATFTIEPTEAAPMISTEFGLRVYVDSNAIYQGGEVSVDLPAGLAYQGTLNTTDTSFNPSTTVTGTTAQKVNLVFVTQSTSLTGKQLVATIPVVASIAGEISITFSNARLADLNDADITPVTANPLSITISNTTLPAPIVSRPGKEQIDSTEDITDLRQTFSISNYDSTASYTVTLGGQNLTVTNGSFSILPSIDNGNLPLAVSVNKDGAGGSAAYTIRLRNPNVNRLGCVDLLDLFIVNRDYGGSSAGLDLNFDGTIGLIDLLTVTTNWRESCI